MVVRQRVLILYLANSALDADVIAWSCHDGASPDDAFGEQPGDGDDPPYRRGMDALRDGWRMIQMSSLSPHAPGAEFNTDYLKYEFVFEKLIDRTTGEEVMR